MESCVCTATEYGPGEHRDSPRVESGGAIAAGSMRRAESDVDVWTTAAGNPPGSSVCHRSCQSRRPFAAAKRPYQSRRRTFAELLVETVQILSKRFFPIPLPSRCWSYCRQYVVRLTTAFVQTAAGLKCRCELRSRPRVRLRFSRSLSRS